MGESVVESSEFIKNGLDNEEKSMFHAIKRDLLKEIAVPKNSDRIMIDIIACEYIKYKRAFETDLPRIAVSCAKAMREFMSELNLTPKSRAETNTATTLSTIFKVLNHNKEDESDAGNTQNI